MVKHNIWLKWLAGDTTSRSLGSVSAGLGQQCGFGAVLGLSLWVTHPRSAFSTSLSSWSTEPFSLRGQKCWLSGNSHFCFLCTQLFSFFLIMFLLWLILCFHSADFFLQCLSPYSPDAPKMNSSKLQQDAIWIRTM